MNKLRSALIAGALTGVISLMTGGSASALPVGAIDANVGEVSSLALFHQAQFNRGNRGGNRVRGGNRGPRVGGGNRAPRVNRGGGNRRSAGGRARRNRNNALGAAAAIGVGAALLGAIAGSANRRSAPREEYYEERRPRRVYDDRPRYRERRSSAVDYCIRKFRSYNPRTGLYRGFDGRMHPCP